MTRALVRWVHRRLIACYGQPAWEPNDAPLDELIGTILSQHTSDVNSQRAFGALKSAFSGWEAVRDAPVDQLTETIRSGGLAVVKAQRIQAVLRALTDDDGRVRLPDLRRMRRAQSGRMRRGAAYASWCPTSTTTFSPSRLWAAIARYRTTTNG